MKQKPTFYARGIVRRCPPLLNVLGVAVTLALCAQLWAPAQQSLAASATSQPPATPTAVIINAVVGTQGTMLWSPAGAPLQMLRAGALLTAHQRSTDTQWLAVQTEDGATGWVATNQVIAANVTGLAAQDIQLTPVTPTPTMVPIATSAPPTNTPRATTAAVAAAITPPTIVLQAETSGNGWLNVQVATTGTALNVRSGPGMSYPVVGKAQPGQTLLALARNMAADWIQVQLPNATAGFGWVAARLVKANAALASLPMAANSAAVSDVIANNVSTNNASANSAATSTPVAAQPVVQNTGATGLHGHLLIQASWGNEIYLYSLDTGQLRLLTSGFDPALSPDGSKVVFTRIGGDNGIYLINTDGSNEHKIFGERQGLFSPKWSPDGQWILFVRTDSYWKCRDVSADRGRYHCEPDIPSLSNYDLIKEYRPQLARIDINGDNYRDIAALDTASAPDWSKGGIVYSSAAGIQTTTDKAQDANRQVAFDEFKKYYMDPDWQPNGGRIVFQRREASHWEIYGVNPDGSGFAALTRPATALVDSQPSNVAPAWSPDGQHIIFLSNRTAANEAGAWGIWVMNADGSNQHPLPVNVEFQYNYVAEQMLDWGP